MVWSKIVGLQNTGSHEIYNPQGLDSTLVLLKHPSPGPSGYKFHRSQYFEVKVSTSCIHTQGRIQDSEKEGAQFCYCEHGNCVQSIYTIWDAKHAKSRGVWGHAPPENFEKLNPLRLNLRAFLMAYCLLLQDSTLQ